MELDTTTMIRPPFGVVVLVAVLATCCFGSTPAGAAPVAASQPAAASQSAVATRRVAASQATAATRRVAASVPVRPVVARPTTLPTEQEMRQALEGVRVGWTDPGRLVSLALVIAGLVLATRTWGRSWGISPDAAGQERSRVACLTGVLLVLYGLLFNGQWVPGGGDEAYYLSIGRTISQTGEFTANGMPVVTVPYGWPYMIAAALKVSASFAFLNLVPMGLVLVALVFWYAILRRVTDARIALAAVIVSAILFHWQRGVVHFYSEPLYFALVAVSGVLALQIAEGRAWGVRLAALLALCVALVLSRFAGVLTFPFLAAALLSGPGRPGRRQWIALALVGATLGGSFLGVRAMLTRNAARDLARMEQVIKAQGKKPAVAVNRVRILKQTAETEMAAEDRIVGRAVKAGRWEYLRRVGQAGVWMSRLFWPPAEMGKSNEKILLASNVAGWMLIAVLLVHVVEASRRRQWLWLGTIGIFLGFVVVWPEPNGRYVAGAAPMLLLGMWLGARKLGTLLENPVWRKTVTVASVGLVGSILACNLPIYAMEVWVNQSPEFQTRVLAGEHAELAGLCRYLNAHALQDNELAVAVDEAYPQTLRVANFLTDRTVLTWPGGGPPTQPLLDWMRQKHVRYYICRPANAPRRLWHVQLAPATQRTSEDPPSYMQLYDLRDGRAVRVCPPDKWAVDRVFGMEDAS